MNVILKPPPPPDPVAPVAPRAPVTPAPVAPAPDAPITPVAPVVPAPEAPVTPVAPVVPTPVAPAPDTPMTPVAPVEPAPVGPVTPVTPVTPVAPAPVGPVTPVTPVAPVEPAPVTPVTPVAPAPTNAAETMSGNSSSSISGDIATPIGADDTEKTDSSGTTEAPAPDDEILELDSANKAQAPQTPKLPANMQRAEIVRGFGHSSTPEQMAAGVTPDYLADMTEMGIQNSHNRRVMRGLQKAMGVNFRPIKGGMRSTDIKLENIKDPRQRQAWTLMKNQLAANEATQSVAGGQRAGWSTAGSGFSGGGVRAARGRGAPAQQLASTGQASSIGNAVMAAQPDVAAPARDATANFNMSEGTGASAAGKMNVVGGPKAWIARGNTEAYDGDPSRSLSIDYKPPTAQTPTPPPPAAASAPVLGPISGDSARGIQASVNKQMAAGSGMALPPPVALDSTDAPASIVPQGDTLAQPDNIDKVAPIPTSNEPIDMGAAGFKKMPAKPPVPSSIRWKQPTSSRIG